MIKRANLINKGDNFMLRLTDTMYLLLGANATQLIPYCNSAKHK